MQQEKILATLTGHDANSCLEIAACCDADDRKGIKLRRLAWGQGVGWYCQQALWLTPEEAEGLLVTLRKSRDAWRGETQQSPGKVIPFPNAAGSQGKPEQKFAVQ